MTTRTRRPIANVDADLVRAYLAALDAGVSADVAHAERALRVAVCRDCHQHALCPPHAARKQLGAAR